MRPQRRTPERSRWPAGPGSVWPGGLLVAIALLLPTPALAGEPTFDALAAASGKSDLSSELEALVMRCDDETDDRERRLCEEVLRTRQARAREQSILVAIDPPRVTLRAKLGWLMTLTGCLMCAEPPVLAGKPRRLTASEPLPTKPPAKAPPGKGEAAPEIRFAILAEVVVPEPNGTERLAVEASLRRLRAEAIVKLRAPRTWSQGDVHGIAIETVAWRVLDPCSGKVYVSRPSSAIQIPQTEDPACKVEKKAVAAPTKGPSLPERLTAADIERALLPVRLQARRCFQKYRIRGVVNLGIDIRPDGSVKMVRSSGSLVDTPSAECVRAAALRIRFPAFRSHTSMHVTFPVLLRQ
ncbi:MAG: hypothetical protein HY906_14635 [Deltaproteobacteria bacterium]|nr:hypothetical protein [Deltaproteobacteria bacterium]